MGPLPPCFGATPSTKARNRGGGRMARMTQPNSIASSHPSDVSLSGLFSALSHGKFEGMHLNPLSFHFLFPSFWEDGGLGREGLWGAWDAASARLISPFPSPHPSLISAIALSLMLSPYFRTFFERGKSSYEGEEIEFYGRF